jgi:hypothetical protein
MLARLGIFLVYVGSVLGKAGDLHPDAVSAADKKAQLLRCKDKLEDAYDYGRWIIQAVGVGLILLALLPLMLLQCVKERGRWLYLGVVATVVLLWIGFCLLADKWVFELYRLAATPILCH